jgi:hypothetical protein
VGYAQVGYDAFADHAQESRSWFGRIVHCVFGADALPIEARLSTPRVSLEYPIEYPLEYPLEYPRPLLKADAPPLTTAHPGVTRARLFRGSSFRSSVSTLGPAPACLFACLFACLLACAFACVFVFFDVGSLAHPSLLTG